MGWRDWFGDGAATSTDDLAREAVAQRAAAPQDAPKDAAAQIQALVHAGEKIEAIKIYRQEYGGSLVEAKDAIDAIARGEASPAPAADRSDDSDVEELVAQGKWIDAIRRYREKYGVDLAEAKAAVEAIQRR